MKRELLRNSLACGFFLMAINFLVMAMGLMPVLIITSHILPGFLFSFVLLQNKNSANWKKILFALLATGLNYLAGRIAMGYSPIAEYSGATFMLGNIVGATVLFILYAVLIERNVNFGKGILFAAGAGLVGSVIPVITDSISRAQHDSATWQSFLYSAAFFTIFPVWQGFFAMAVELSRKEFSEAETVDVVSV